MIIRAPLTPMQILRKRIEELFPLVPKRPGWRSPEYVHLMRGKRRGKDGWVAGYGHSRMHAHHMSGLVTDRVVGFGDTPEAAVDAMETNLKRIKEQK